MKKLLTILFSLISFSLLLCCCSDENGSNSSNSPGDTHDSGINKTGPPTPGVAEIIPGNDKLSLSWVVVDEADSYQVWYGTSGSTEDAEQSGGDILGTYYTITGLTNGTEYFVWLKAKNTEGTSGFGEIASAIVQVPGDQPNKPNEAIVVAGDKELTVYWAPFYTTDYSENEKTEAYELWYSRLSLLESAEQTGEDIVGDSYTVTGLTNEFKYYFWVRAKNFWGVSDFTEASSGEPKAPSVSAEPPAPIVVAGNNELGIFWNDVEEAVSYEVWYDTSGDTGSAVQAGGDIEGTAYTITGLSNGTTYYVWLKAKNTAGTSGFSEQANGAPAVTLDFETAASPGDRVNINIGSKPAVMIYANSSTEEIVFPMETDDSTTDTISRRFFISESEITNDMIRDVYQWAYDNGKFSHDFHDHNFINMNHTNWLGTEIVSTSMTRNPMLFFYGGKYVVSDHKHDHPATWISWFGAVLFCNWLTEMRDGQTGNVVYSNIGYSITQDLDKTGYRLATTEEWEFAARWVGTTAGTRTDLVSLFENNPNNLPLTSGYFWTPGNYASGATADYTDEEATNLVSWPSGNLQPVKGKQPNALGIYDMSGNIREYVSTDFKNRGGYYFGNTDEFQVGHGGDYKNPTRMWRDNGIRLCRSK